MGLMGRPVGDVRGVLGSGGVGGDCPFHIVCA